jgi:hypothetical protein
VTNFHQKVQRKKRKSRNFLYASLTQSHHQTKKLDNQTAYLEFNYLNIISVCFFNDLSSRQKKKQIQSKTEQCFDRTYEKECIFKQS